MRRDAGRPLASAIRRAHAGFRTGGRWADRRGRSAPAEAVGPGRTTTQEEAMSVYRVTEVIGTSEKSWEDAARQAVAAASESLRDLRVSEVVDQDLTLARDGSIESFRTKLR